MNSRLQAFFDPDAAGPVAQFFKYAVSGGIATGVNVVTLFLAAWLLFPCLTPDDPFVRLFGAFGVTLPTPALTDAVRSSRTMLCSVPAFLLSNAVCYTLNVLFVFKSGRHGRVVEFLLFLLASGIAALAGALLAGALVRWTGIAFTYASVANLVTAVLVNYVARKKIVFNG